MRTILAHTGEPGWAASLMDMGAWPGGSPRCCYVHFCCCLAAGDVALRVDRNYFYDCCWGGIFGIATCTNGLCWGPTREAVRGKYGSVPGVLVLDVAVTTLLPCCYLAQALNHIDILEMGRGPALPVALPVAPPVQRAMEPVAPAVTVRVVP